MRDTFVPKAVLWIARTLEESGFETWAVGGAVRNRLLGTGSEDWDLATRARPTDVQRLFPRTIPVGLDHGTVGVLSREGVLYEVTTFRRDVETFGRHAKVEFADSLEEDLARRDFTINAVALHPLRDELRDPFDGRGDLERKRLRTVGRAPDRFREDYLRILRALRFAGTLGLTIEAETWRALVAGTGELTRLSPERLREELEKILSSGAPPSRSLALYAAAGVLGALYPELEALRGEPHGTRGDWFSHTLRVVDALSPLRPMLRWAALLHGVGEPEGDLVADRGEAVSSDERAVLRAAAVLERLRSSNARIRDVGGLVRCIAYPPDPLGSDATLRRWLAGAGRESLSSVLRIWTASTRADACFGHGWTEGHLLALARRLRAVAQSEVPLTVTELSFSGRDLIQMGYEPGPDFGELLDHLLDLTLDDPTVNEFERLGEEAQRWMEGSRS